MILTRDTWTSDDYALFLEYLLSLTDFDYKNFNSKIIPDTPHFFGIRMGEVRKIAKAITKGNYREFLACPIGDYHEERVIEGIVLSSKKCDYNELLADLKYMSSRIYNWAICDSLTFSGIKKYRDEFMGDALWFIKNQNPWAIRLGLLCLMKFYLDDEYIDRVFELVNLVNSDFYYVNMMQAWLVATAFCKCHDRTLEYLARNKLSDVTQNMAIQKIRDSLRVSKSDKDYILRYKR